MKAQPVSTVASALLIAALSSWFLYPGSAQAQTWNFDPPPSGTTVGSTVPFGYTSGGVTATFSSPNNIAFNIENDLRLGAPPQGYTPASFGNYLFDSTGTVAANNLLDIKFSQFLTTITLDFATIDVDGNLSGIQLSAFSNLKTSLVGTTPLTEGTYGTTVWPYGPLTFSSATPFNLVEITVPQGQASGTVRFLIDNITVVTVPEPNTVALASAGAGLLLCWTVVIRRRRP